MILKKVPKGWREGQTIFNFLWFLKEQKLFHSEMGFSGTGEPEYAKTRMADPFHIPDKQLEKLFDEFLLLHS